MEKIKEMSHTAAWQIHEEIGLSGHSVERVSEIIAEKINEQKAIDAREIHFVSKRIVDKAWQWIVDWVFENAPHEVFDELMSSREDYIKAMEE